MVKERTPRQNNTLPHQQVTVEVIVLVYNEEVALPKSMPVLCAYLETYFSYRWSVVIVDNASADSTLHVASNLATAYHPHVSVLHLKEKGRGRALKAAWLSSEADILAYMDVDLSTNLYSFLPLIAPLATGHSDLSIGSRLLKSAMVTRQWKREVISRCYNLLIKAMFGNHFSDEKCSFKVIKAAWRRSWGPKSRTGSGSLTRSCCCWLRSKATASPKCRSCNAFDATSSEAEITQLKEAIKRLPERARYVLVGEALRPRRYEASHAR